MTIFNMVGGGEVSGRIPGPISVVNGVPLPPIYMKASATIRLYGYQNTKPVAPTGKYDGSYAFTTAGQKGNGPGRYGTGGYDVFSQPTSTLNWMNSERNTWAVDTIGVTDIDVLDGVFESPGDGSYDLKMSGKLMWKVEFLDNNTVFDTNWLQGTFNNFTVRVSMENGHNKLALTGSHDFSVNAGVLIWGSKTNVPYARLTTYVKECTFTG